ncbi:MAG: hypothetical protein RL391_1338 [Actinomycetota bacterium]|jgi:putative SOS response-associated peptidase YedK
MKPPEGDDGTVAQSTPTDTVVCVCGRFTSITPPEVLAQIFDAVAEPTEREFQANFNVAPTTKILAVANDTSNQRRLGRFSWGLVPGWAKDSTGAARLINARSETVFEKPSFRPSIPGRRCLIPMDGFFEWRTVYSEARSAKAQKEPVYVTRQDGNPLAVAGLWATWTTPEGPSLRTCCVITTAANSTMSSIHDRMPVIVEADDWDDWLDRGLSDRARLDEIMVPAHESILDVIDVSTRVNSIRNNAPDLIDPIER